MNSDDPERQALAMMDHPNIAKVLDAWMTEGDFPSDRSAGDSTKQSAG